jgi:4,5-DOPA dioxygenase extradiol
MSRDGAGRPRLLYSREWAGSMPGSRSASKPGMSEAWMTRTAKKTRMPALFLGHGDPMNALRDNAFTRSLSAFAASLPSRPRAVLMLSAHWLTEGSFASEAGTPETIHDFGGFPDELYRVEYPAPGAPELARRAASLVPGLGLDPDRGLDHGAWSVLKHMFPEAEVPVFQVSVHLSAPFLRHLELGRALAPLRDEGVLIVGSGNIVHNLREVAWEAAPFPWAVEFDAWVKERLEARDAESLVDIARAGPSARSAVPSPDHYVPLLYALGASSPEDELTFTYEEIVHGSLSMRCARFG